MLQKKTMLYFRMEGLIKDIDVELSESLPIST